MENSNEAKSGQPTFARKNCTACGALYTPVRRAQKFCSARCRHKTWIMQNVRYLNREDRGKAS